MKKRETYIRIAGWGSISILAIIALLSIYPNVDHSSSALDCLNENNCTTAMVEAEAEVKVKTSIAVATSSKVAMEVIPTSTGATTIGSTNLSVFTNSIDGYALYMHSSDGLTNTSTVHDDKVDVEKISIISAPATLSNMESNSYGYELGETAANSSTVFKVLPTTDTIVKQTTSTTGGTADTSYGYGDTYTLSFGVKVGTELPAGTYAGSVTVSAIANPETVRSMAGLEYMQDMTHDICSNTRVGYTKQLIDTRDGKSYWVAKLKDGNCWMTQNLALDITEAGLSAADTDIEEDWNQESTYPPKKTNVLPIQGSSILSVVPITGTYSWNFGDSLQATPLIAKNCGGGDDSIRPVSGDKIGDICEKSGFIDVDETWKPTFATQSGSWAFDDGTIYTGWVAANKTSKTYDSHYLIGNYYLWNAITAGTGGVLESGQASGSICPKNWKLPTTTSDSLNSSGTYIQL